MTKIDLYYPPAVRYSYIVFDDFDDGDVEVGPMLTDQEVYCDLCNVEVPLRPAPLIGSYVLCLECLGQIVPDWYSQVDPAIIDIWQQGER
ncbi:MAG: hypothetical protein WHV66_00300 [Anaerolineales bacterium]